MQAANTIPNRMRRDRLAPAKLPVTKKSLL
jgi:hypothetical protein